MLAETIKHKIQVLQFQFGPYVPVIGDSDPNEFFIARVCTGFGYDFELDWALDENLRSYWETWHAR